MTRDRDIRAKPGCYAKRSYASPNQADKVAKQMRRQKNEVFTTYRCWHCGRWHVGEKASL